MNKKPAIVRLDGDHRTGSMVVRGDEIQEERSICIDGTSVESIIEELTKYAHELNDATIEMVTDRYDGFVTPYVVGFRKMNDQERKRADKLHAQLKARNAKWDQEKLERERKEYERLKKKYEE